MLLNKIPILFLFIAFLGVSCQTSYTGQIRQELDNMEQAWADSNFLRVAQAYSKDGYLINKDTIAAHGEAAIIDYWQWSNSSPTSWDLIDWVTSTNLEHIYAHPEWSKVKSSMPLWTDHNIDLPETPVYQLGQSVLARRRKATPEKIDTSIVTFLLVWKETEEGYKIYVDAYD